MNTDLRETVILFAYLILLTLKVHDTLIPRKINVKMLLSLFIPYICKIVRYI